MPSQNTNCNTPECHVSVSVPACAGGLEKQAGRGGGLEGDVTEEEDEEEECD